MSKQFYQAFADKYDQIFPLKEQTLQFLDTVFHPANTVLDIGCATGMYANHLAHKNRHVLGIDLSDTMIDHAHKQKTNAFVRYQVRDMTTLHEQAHYDGLYSIGNTVVHLDGLDAVQAFIRQCYKALKPKGKMVIQLLNYDRIIDQNIHALPMIKTPHLSFKRTYRFIGDHVRFETSITSNQKTVSQSTLLYPIRYGPLLKALKDARFKKIEAYDGFTDKPYDINESYALVIVAHAS